MLDRAVEFATRAHEGQCRKGTSRPYIVHPLEVARIVAAMTDDEEVIAAAVLHDTIEDCPGVTKELLTNHFGERVASLVAMESEDKTKSWEERKGATILRLRSAIREIQLISLADKLSNMRDIDRDYPICKEQLWQRFRMKSRRAIGWYYLGVRDALSCLSGQEPYAEYCRLVEKYFDETSFSQRKTVPSAVGEAQVEENTDEQ